MRPMPEGVKVSALALLAILAFTGQTAAQSCLQESAWQNSRNSSLFLEDISSEGLISGYYINRAAGFGCQNTAYPVTGWILENTNTITFTVKWENTAENCQSITAWTGFFSPDCRTITTLWQLVVNGTTSTGQISQGQDTFTRVALKKSTFIQKKK
jgi:avidin family protein